MTRPDPHSHLTDDQPRVRHIDWAVDVDFAAYRLDCSARIHFDRPGPAQVTLDTRALDIASVRGPGGESVGFQLGEHDDVLGEPLTFTLPGGADQVTIAYATSPDSTALQWVSPAQTSGGAHHFLYSQCQTIHARSMIPLHDSMSARLTYTAEVTVPEGYTALMSATSVGSRPADAGRRTFTFSASKGMPPYLVVLLVGHVESAVIGPRTRIWAEPDRIQAAAFEFAEVETLLKAGEALFGPHPWDNADLVVMPPSYPFGGMENPQLTYLTPTLITGDRSLVDVLSHELAHHWSGNMLTAASMEHFWINEGFATYGERRITESVHGRDVSELNAALLRVELEADLVYFADRPEHLKLRRRLAGEDPDTTSSWVSHEKGYLFVRALEESVGRDRFDAFIRLFFERYAFSAVTTEEFLVFARRELTESFDYEEWLYASGLPAAGPRARSVLLDQVRAVGQQAPTGEDARQWRSEQWLVYVGQLEAPKSPEFLAELDDRFGLLTHSNLEIRWLWLLLGLRSGYAPAVDASLEFVASVGRMRFLKPLYDELVGNPVTRERAVSCYVANRHRYHPIAVNVVKSRMSKLGIDPDHL
ncbi:M1 family metallopeptidase [Sphaerisporangium sp. NPDC051017]|uniref:M1 family metallopeptidase n=1 Tax=Sphaerisporangium sp. NPDC051017 TaxID=3154636 RepID=UPI00343AB5FE